MTLGRSMPKESYHILSIRLKLCASLWAGELGGMEGKEKRPTGQQWLLVRPFGEGWESYCDSSSPSEKCGLDQG